MRILWHSNSAHAPSGYGNQTALFTPLIRDQGYGINISATYGVEGVAGRNTDGIIEFPRLGDKYGNDILPSHYGYTSSDVVISLLDPFALSPDVMKRMNWVSWTPVDTAPVWEKNIQSLKAAKVIWSMSRFGHEQLRNAGFDPVYVPHGVNTDIYKPVDRSEARQRMADWLEKDLQDKYLVVTVAANIGSPSRKNFAGMFEAFAGFAASHPDAVFYVHTERKGRMNGDDLLTIARFYGIEDKLIFPPEYDYLLGLISPEMMNNIYNAADVFMLLSYGEGFGIPVLEAQAAGCTVIVTDGSAQAELCLSGWKVQADKIHAIQGRWGTYWWQARVLDAVDALTKSYKERGNAGLRAQAWQRAKQYDYQTVFEKFMLPALHQLEVFDNDEWSHTGWLQDGAAYFPSRNPKSDRAIKKTDTEREVVSGFGLHGLDIEDAEHCGGVSKIVAKEIITTYQLDTIELQDGDTVIDVGAHVGVVSCYLGKRFKLTTIYAFEPNPLNFEKLVRNVKANGLEGTVIPINKAVTSDGRNIVLHGNHELNTGGMGEFVPSGDSDIEVKSVTLRQIFDDYEIYRCQLLKLDCEGAEHEIVHTANSLLQRVQRIVGEVHENNVLQAKGYTFDTFMDKVQKYVELVRVNPCPIPDVVDVSVIIPTRNGESTIQRAIDSALNIEGVEVEVVVCNDASTDNTLDILRSYGTRIKVLSVNAQVGQVAAMNIATKYATGRYIFFYGDDDWAGDGLAALVKALDDASEQVAFAYGGQQYHGKRDDFYMPQPFSAEAFYQHNPILNGVIWRKSLFDNGLSWYTPDPKTPYPQDWDFSLQVIEKGYTGVLVPDTTVLHYTLAEGRETSRMNAQYGLIVHEMAKRFQKMMETAYG